MKTFLSCFRRHLLTKLAQSLENFSLRWTIKFYSLLFICSNLFGEKRNKFCCKLVANSKYLLHSETATRLQTDALHTCTVPRPAPLNRDAHTPTQTELNQWEGTRRNFDAVFNALTRSPDAQESANSDTEYP